MASDGFSVCQVGFGGSRRTTVPLGRTRARARHSASSTSAITCAASRHPLITYRACARPARSRLAAPMGSSVCPSPLPATRCARWCGLRHSRSPQRGRRRYGEHRMPSSYLSPGVYMEEVSSGSRPIEAVGTAVAAFVGFAETGPLNEPVLVTNWTQFKAAFGDFVDGYYLAHAVYGYFLNGGGTAYVVRVGGAAGGDNASPVAELPSSVDGRAALTVSAKSPEPGISVEVQPAGEPSDDTFKLVVKRGGQPV